MVKRSKIILKFYITENLKYSFAIIYDEEYLMPYKDPEKAKENKKEYYVKNKKTLNENNKDWYAKNREKVLAFNKECYSRNKKPILERNREWRLKNKEKIKIWWHNLKLKVLIHYSGDPPKCACCGESEYNFLQIDHVNGGGNRHRKSIKVKCGSKFYYWLWKNNFPEGYQVLCANCNWGKRMNNGVCPHKKEI